MAALIATILGLALGFGLLRMVPLSGMIKKGASIVFLVWILGLALAGLNFPMLADFIANYPMIVAFTVGTAAGGVLSELF